MRDTLLRLTVEQSADLPAAGLATMVKAIVAADKDLSESDKRHLTVIRGNAELRQGNSDLAESLFDQALMIDADDYLTIWLRGRCKEVTRRFDSAIEDCEKSLELKPDFPAAMLSLAAIYVEKGDFDEASQWMEKIDMLDEYGDERWEYFVRAVMPLKLRKLPDAVEYADKSLAGDDQFLFVPLDKILMTKAIANLSSGQSAAAKDAIRQVLSFQPSNPQALQMMWSIHNQAGDHLAAYMFAKHLVKVDEKNEKFHLLEMRSLLQLRQIAAAEQVALQILKINPDNVESKTLLEKLQAAKTRKKLNENAPAKEEQDAKQPEQPNLDQNNPTDPDAAKNVDILVADPKPQ